MGGIARLGAALAAAAVVLAPTRGAAQAPDAPGDPRAGGHGRVARPGFERLARVIQAELRLTDAQAARLRAVSGRYAERRHRLMAEERAARRTLRHELRAGDAADSARVDGAIAVLVDAQRRRAALLRDEQRELAAFLSPVQRARFLALQERARHAAQRARTRRGDSSSSAEGPLGRHPFR